MSRLASIVAALLLALLLQACAGPGAATTRSQDLAALQGVVDAFRTAIVRKDKPAFMALFFSNDPQHVTWQSVVDDPSLRRLQKTRPQAIKARRRPELNFVSFIDEVVASPAREEEQFSDVQIDSDGEVASVSFDYVYLSDGRATNHGREKWLLVRTEQGWKIVSVVFTIRLPEAAGGG